MILSKIKASLFAQRRASLYTRATQFSPLSARLRLHDALQRLRLLGFVPWEYPHGSSYYVAISVKN